MAHELTFFDISPCPGGPLYSANTWKTRMSLLQKGVRFETVEVSMLKLRTEIVELTKNERPLLPMIQLKDGRFVVGSFEIALWLETTYPDAPSLFTPMDPKPTAEAYATAVALARVLDAGIGASDPEWSTFFELSMPGIVAAQTTDWDRDYITSDYKMGIKDGWKKMQALDKGQLLSRARNSLIPFRDLLDRPGVEFVTSAKAPGFVDYVLFGRYCMIAAVDRPLGDEAFGPVREWVDRMLDLYDRHARELLKREMPR